jgi:alpha-beta hydrolase superfamily lysophospholipase
MALASPAFSVKLYVPFAVPGLRLMRALRGNFFVNSYVKARLLTHDRERQASYDSDPLIARAISVNILLGLPTRRRVVRTRRRSGAGPAVVGGRLGGESPPAA